MPEPLLSDCRGEVFETSLFYKSVMSAPEKEIIVEPDEQTGDTRPVVATRTVDAAVCAFLLGLAVLLGYDNWRTGIGWASDGPKAGYFPFYLSLVLGAASVYGIGAALFARASGDDPFVNRNQLKRVLQVFLPTLLFCLCTQWLGLYVASFLLVAGFMWIIGRIALWKSLFTSFLFALVMFITFEIAFDVIMPKGPLEAYLGY